MPAIITIVAIVAVIIILWYIATLNGFKQTEGDREHHCRGGCIADPSGADHTCEADCQENPARRVSHPFHRHNAVGDALVKRVDHHTLRNQESSHK